MVSVMLEDSDKDNVFNIVHSLPVIGHSVTVATRTPASGYGQQPKYLPDYGGILETPWSRLKNNSLTTGLPFQPTSIQCNMSRFDTPSGATQQKQDCLIVDSYLHSDSPDQYSIIRAIEKNLYFGSIEDSFPDQESSVVNYASLPFPDDIEGIKYSGKQLELLALRFSRSVKTIKINPNFEIPETTSSPSDNSESAVNIVYSIPERRNLIVKDVCINPFNTSLQAIASDNVDFLQVKIYDLSSSSRQPIQTFNQDIKGQVSTNDSLRYLRSRAIRIFEPNKPALRGVQEICNIPSHLVNMLLTTSQDVSLIDPRSSNISLTYVDKSSIPSFYPIEYLRRTLCSQKNDYQFYSLTNIHLRVFDTRFPGMPMNQQNHMLDSEVYDSMNLKMISMDEVDLEILCASSKGRLCFSTFDQTRKGRLVNPRASHMPYHEPTSEEMLLEGNPELFGLDLRNNVLPGKESPNEVLFSVYQMTESGDISMRRFLPNQEDSGMDLVYESHAAKILQNDRLVNKIVENSEAKLGTQCKDRDVLETGVTPEEVNYINILETDIYSDIEDRFQSKRALERFEKMKIKLDRS